MALRIIVGVVVTVAALALAGRRLWWLYRVARTGQPAPERVAAVRSHPGRDVGIEATEVIGQRKLLRWSVPGRRARRHVLGLHYLAADHPGGLRRPVQQDLRHPGHRPLGVHRLHRGPVRGRGAGRDHHVRGHPAAVQTPGGWAATPGSPARTPVLPGWSCWESSWSSPPCCSTGARRSTPVTSPIRTVRSRRRSWRAGWPRWAPRPTARSRPPPCWPRSRCSWRSWSSSPTPSTCTSSWPR